MKAFALIAVLCIALVLASCGGGSSPSATAAHAPPHAPPFPHISAPSGPPPKRVVVKDLKKGSGDVIKANDAFAVRYVSFDYGTGDVREDHWGNDSIFSWSFGPGKVVRAWVKGLPGMREGGRRELIAPARLAYGTHPEIWVIELLSVGSSGDDSSTASAK